MKKEFEDIFESINHMHKKYNSKEYLENLDKFTNNSKDLEQILEKYNVDSSQKKHKRINLLKKFQKKS